MLFTQDFVQLKGECARSISFSLLLDLFICCLFISLCLLWQSAFFILSSFLCPPPPWEHYYSAADALNSISQCYCNVRWRKRGRYCEVNRRGWETNHFMHVLIVSMIYMELVADLSYKIRMMKVKAKIYVQETPRYHPVRNRVLRRDE